MISHSAFSTIVTLSVDMKKAQIQVYKAEADLQEIEERFFNVKVKQEGHPGHYVWAQLEKTKRALAARTLEWV